MIDYDALVLAPLATIFGEAVQWIPATGSTVTGMGVFLERNVEVRFDATGEVRSERPSVSVRIAEFGGSPLQDDLFVIRGVTYAVSDVHLDGEGEARCMLRLAASGPLRP